MIPLFSYNPTAALAAATTFSAPLQSSLVPETAYGSSTPTFTRATTATVWGYDPTDVFTLLTCASGEARFMGARRISQGVWSSNFSNGSLITPANGGNSAVCDASGPFGYLAEGARTNLCLQSEVMGTTWSASNITIAANSVAAPDGATTADTLTASAGNGTLIQDLGTIASAVKTFSIWLKRLTGTGNIDLTLDGGSTWTTKTITSSWARYDITQTLADPDCGIRIVTNADAVYAWGAQVEAASFASTYIATTTAAVTRNADVLTYAVAGNFAAVPGTFYAEYFPVNTNGALFGGSGLPNLRHEVTTRKIAALLDSVVALQTTANAGTLGALNKVAAVFAAGDNASSLNGGTVATSSDATARSATANLIVGNDAGGLAMYAPMRSLRYYATRLPNTRLQSLTA
jgi:hypothetical protein